MLKVAITGGIGSGKSAVCGILAEKGFAVIDVDSIVSSLYGVGGIAGRVRKIFGSLDRKKIAEQAFSEPGKRKELESILHPAAMGALEGKIKALRLERFVFVEAPLLFESGFQEFFDFVVAVTAPEDARTERLLEKGLSPRDAAGRMQAQLQDRERVKKADFVIDNSGSAGQLEKQVELLLKELGGLNA